jgi:hypothetical protein
MKSLPVLLFRLEIGVRWTARVLAVLLVGMVLWFLIAEIGGNQGVTEDRTSQQTTEVTSTPPMKQVLGQKLGDAVGLTWLFTICIGLVVALRWPLIGGSITTAMILLGYAFSIVVFRVVLGLDYVAAARSVLLGPGLFFNLMLITGILFMVSGYVRRRTSAVGP